MTYAETWPGLNTVTLLPVIGKTSAHVGRLDRKFIGFPEQCSEVDRLRVSRPV